MELAIRLLQQALFIGVLALAGRFIAQRARFIWRNIHLGRSFTVTGNPRERLGNMLRLAFGQQKMFDRPIVGLLHLAIYAGFLLINLEVAEIVLDGILGTHRLFLYLLPLPLYRFLIDFFEVMALGVVVSCVLFFSRRNIMRLARFQMPELKGWPSRDANIILVWEVALMACLYTMNATDSILQGREVPHYEAVGSFVISGYLVPLFDGLSTGALMAVERLAWWVHILGILAFAVYVTYSKHLHIFLAFPNTYFGKLTPNGEMENMPAITAEVASMVGIPVPQGAAGADASGTFGAKDVQDLRWVNLLNAYSCTECGRCTSVCPANLTGKLLSPRKVMMDTRDRLEELGRAKDAQGADFHDGKALYGDYLSKEEIMACTSCNACVQACPISIDPLNIILEIRRYIAMEESGTPHEWNLMFQNLENSQSPWAFPAADRFKWADELKS